MKISRRVMIVFLVVCSIAAAQGGKGQGSSQSNPSGGTGGLTGLSWSQDSWSRDLMPLAKDIANLMPRLLCYRLRYTYSAAQPFLLEKMPPGSKIKSKEKDLECSTLDEKTPLMMRERLVIVIDAYTVRNLDRVRLFNLNITNQQGNAINPTPIRPSFAGGTPQGTVTAEAARGPFFLLWPDRLPADVIPTVSVNIVYTPPAPGTAWSPMTFYPVGSVVVPLSLNGHYYTATTAGISYSSEPDWKRDPLGQVDEPNNPNLKWLDETPFASPLDCGPSPKPWHPDTDYAAGSCVHSKSMHLWVASVGGKSGNGNEPFRIASAPSDSQIESNSRLKWIDNTPAPSECRSARGWQAGNLYPAHSCVVSQNGRFWTSSGGMSGTNDPLPVTSYVGNSVKEATGAGIQWTDRTLISSPSACAQSPKPWQPNSVYSSGSCVTSSNSHLWLATVGGVSGAGGEPFPFDSFAGDTTEEKADLTWVDAGTTAPPGSVKTWLPGAMHVTGDVILDRNTGHYYIAVHGGTAGQKEPTFPVTQSSPQPEKGLPADVPDGSETWMYYGTVPPQRKSNQLYPNGSAVFSPANSHYYIASQPDPDPLDFAKLGRSGAIDVTLTGDPINDGTVVWKDVGDKPEAIRWKSNHKYFVGTVVYSVTRSRYYVASSPGQQMTHSGDDIEPDFPNDLTYRAVQWVDSGFSAPSSIASGQPADQTANLLNLTLPQTHVIATYNLAAGVVYNTLRSPSFSVNNGVTTQTGSSHIVDPVLVLTAYWLRHWFPLDPESEWRPRDLVPGLSLAFSLSSPTNNFYVGGSSEFFIRNVQLTYGVSIAKLQRAAPGGNGMSPSTTQHFHEGGFVGLTFNISGFIQGLVSGGGGKSSGP